MERTKKTVAELEEARVARTAYWKRYYKANRLVIIERAKKYQREHKDKVRERSKKEPRQARSKAQYHLLRITSLYRRTFLQVQTDSVTTMQHHIEMLPHVCHWCGTTLSDLWHVDHKTPLARGGDNIISNVVKACPSCNIIKSDKSLEEWLVYMKDNPRTNYLDWSI